MKLCARLALAASLLLVLLAAAASCEPRSTYSSTSSQTTYVNRQVRRGQKTASQSAAAGSFAAVHREDNNQPEVFNDSFETSTESGDVELLRAGGIESQPLDDNHDESDHHDDQIVGSQTGAQAAASATTSKDRAIMAESSAFVSAGNNLALPENHTSDSEQDWASLEESSADPVDGGAASHTDSADYSPHSRLTVVDWAKIRESIPDKPPSGRESSQMSAASASAQAQAEVEAEAEVDHQRLDDLNEPFADLSGDFNRWAGVSTSAALAPRQGAAWAAASAGSLEDDIDFGRASRESLREPEPESPHSSSMRSLIKPWLANKWEKLAPVGEKLRKTSSLIRQKSKNAYNARVSASASASAYADVY